MTSLNPVLSESVTDRCDAINFVTRDFDVPVESPEEKRLLESCTEELFETDVRYFEIATKSVDLSGGRLFWSPGRTSIPLGCVVLRVEEPESAEQAREWLAGFEQKTLQVGSRLSRIYIQSPNPLIESALNDAGYDKEPEVAFVGPATAPTIDTNVKLQLMQSESDLDTMARIDAENPVGPDGHAVDVEIWNEIIRQKWRTGELSLYFIMDRGEIGGTVGAMNSARIMRLKNLVVRPSHRKRGLGRGAALALWNMAFDSGKRLATFGVPEGGGYATYKSAGLHPTWPQHEWCKKLTV